MSFIKINGKKISVNGSNINIVNGQISVDGKIVTSENLQGEVTIILGRSISKSIF